MYNPVLLSLLSGMTFNETTGKLIGARALLSNWLLKQANGTVDEAGELVDPVFKLIFLPI